MTTEQLLVFPNSFPNSFLNSFEEFLGSFFSFPNSPNSFTEKKPSCRKSKQCSSLENCFVFLAKLFRLFGIRFLNSFQTVQRPSDGAFGGASC